MEENERFVVPNIKIEVDGNEIPTHILEDIDHVEMEEEINTASTFVLTFGMIDKETKTWKYTELNEFSLGQAVKLFMGMDKAKPLISGEITSIESDFNERFATIEVRGFDRLHLLRLQKKRRNFLSIKDSDLASQIAGDWGLSAEVEATSTVYPYLSQNNQNDLEFLLERGKRIRYELGVQDKTLFFRKSKEKDTPSLVLEYGIDIEEFSAKLSTRYEANKIDVQGWDFKSKKAISGTASLGDEVSQMDAKETGGKKTESAFGLSSSAVVREALVDATEAETIAKAQLNMHLVEAVIGEGKAIGNALIRSGETIHIKEIGGFSGIYYITSTKHRIDSEGYYTQFQVRRTGI